MASDLISRSATIQRFIQEIEDSGSNVMHINTIKRVLQDIETAYDVDAVVKELENQAEQYRQRGFEAEAKGYSAMADKKYGKYCSYKHATEIVKGGGKV